MGNEKKNFKFQISVISNNFEKDENLSNFFYILNNSIKLKKEEESVNNELTNEINISKLNSNLNCTNEEIIEILKRLPFSSIGSKLPIVLDFLFEIIITNENEEIKLKSFYCLMTLIQSFQKENNENHKQLISYYLKFIFKFSEINLILPYLIIYLYDKNKPKEIYFEIYWFIFSMILKSISILELNQQQKKKENKEMKEMKEEEEIKKNFKFNFKKLIDNLIDQISNFIESNFDFVNILIFEISYFLRLFSTIFEK